MERILFKLVYLKKTVKSGETLHSPDLQRGDLKMSNFVYGILEIQIQNIFDIRDIANSKFFQHSKRKKGI